VPDFPQGFKTAAVAAGIKKEGLDLGLIYSVRHATAAAVFTKNAFPAAPILVSRAHLAESRQTARAILVNSGNANASTGQEGIAVSEACAAHLAQALSCAPAEVLISSTGVIGRPLSSDKIAAAIPGLVVAMKSDDAEPFARAIMTTDTVPKIASATSGNVRMLGFAKGAGMIHPDMATMLSFVITDAKVSFVDLDRALRYAVDRSFHSITVDGDTSTNDTVIVLANGASGVAVTPEEFTEQLGSVCQDLAKAIARDGEGASKFVEIVVEGAPSDDAARHIGRTVARSPLVKTAIYGCDPNWGRLICAVGNSGVHLDSDQVELYVEDIPLMGGDLAAAQERLRSKEIHIRIVLHSGTGQARIWTCDFTEEYIRINADYTT
jgi:glutamate N-acetyltransferase/amino-acid N-acetyltransferase